MNSSMLTPLQSWKWKNSFFNLPKSPSQAELSGEHPFFDIDRVIPFSLQILIQPGQR